VRRPETVKRGMMETATARIAAAVGPAQGLPGEALHGLLSEAAMPKPFRRTA